MLKTGDRVTYVGNMAEAKGMRGVVTGPGKTEGRYQVEWLGLGSVIDMSDTVLSKDSEPEETKMTQGGKHYYQHQDGTVSTRTSKTMVYTYAVESVENRWLVAKIKHAEARKIRADRLKFIEAVKGGKVAYESDPLPHSPDRSNVYLVHADGERYWLDSGSPMAPVDLKAAVRDRLSRYDEQIARAEAEGREAESGPQFHYGIYRWSQTPAAANKAQAEFTRNHGAGTTTFRVVKVHQR
ncbi:hypothetical protein PV343_01295 [Streptomyces sp. WI03-4A]|uniref:hypothetical protein n=1 Tax=Streptomyces sp. WI03-4A TaxID=3028706 RepID=UPI0029A149B3|nr:hypothetical protein [Streptomyces sp. WI03-4A]MDX2590959.1 hypothetical protein [Streptomyces sp. WI03-4A]